MARWAVVLWVGCATATGSPVETAAELRALLDAPFVRAAPRPRIAEGVELELRLANADALDTGAALELSLTLVNRSDDAVQALQPSCGAWGEESVYSIELVGEDGEVVPSALGWAPFAMPCDEEVTTIEVAEGARAELSVQPPDALRHVLPSARPGTYRLRVRYRNDDGPTPLAIVSNEVPITVRGGDERLWRCRLEQVRNVHDFLFVSSMRPALVPDVGGASLVYVRYALGRNEPSRVMIAQLDAEGRSRGSPRALWDTRAIDPAVTAVRTSQGLLIAAMLERGRLSIGTDGGPAHELASIYPNAFSLAAHGARAAIVYVTMDDSVMLALLDAGGAASRTIALAPAGSAWPDAVALALDDTGGWAAFSNHDNLVAIRRFAIDGALSPERRTALSGLPQSVRATADGLDIAYTDRISGRAPNDLMGFFFAHVGADGATRVGPRALSPTDQADSHPGVAVWNGDRMATAYVSGDGSAHVGANELTRSVRFDYLALAAVGDGFLVAWPDTRDDHGPSCFDRHQCATELYAARVDAHGRIGTSYRVTTDARPEPTPIVDVGWERWCPEQ